MTDPEGRGKQRVIGRMSIADEGYSSPGQIRAENIFHERSLYYTSGGRRSSALARPQSLIRHGYAVAVEWTQ